MTKLQFLYELDEKLAMLSDADRNKSLEYYSEMIEDRMEDGLSEKAAVAALGSIDEIYNDIISEMPLHRIIGAKIKRASSSSTSRSVWMWILIIFGCLVFGLPVIASAFAGLISVLAALWSVVISLWATTLALMLGGVAGVILFFPTIFIGTPVKSLFILGAGLFSLGLVVPFFYLSKLTSKGASVLTRKTLTLLKKIIVR